jgi:hypothetical protein
MVTRPLPVTEHDGEYVRRLGAVLRQRDTKALRAFLIEQAGRYGDERQVQAIREQSDAELAMILHRMIVVRSDLTDLHAESERWLADQGGPTDRGPQPASPAGSKPKPRGHHPPRRAQRRPNGGPSPN